MNKYQFVKKINDTEETGIAYIGNTIDDVRLVCLCTEEQSVELLSLLNRPYTLSQVHRCPVCNGNGLVPNGFYRQTSMNWGTTDATPEKCKSCDGLGILWHN